MLGVGDSREAPYVLRGPIAAGTWHLVGDGEDMVKTVDVRFDIIWRTAAKVDTVLATTTHTFVQKAGSYDAIMFDADLPGIAAAATPGDLLVLRFNTIGGVSGAYYIPNGDGPLAKGRDPNLTLP